MKYLRYLAICIFKLISKTPIWWIMFHLVRPFRKYARNVVYNYVLQNDVYLKRLLERKPKYIDGYYEITNIRGTKDTGVIKYRKISWIEYNLVVRLIWIWLDDDSNYDTTDLTFASKVAQWLHFTWLPKFIVNKVTKEVELMKADQFGNSFDLGDNKKERFYPVSSTL